MELLIFLGGIILGIISTLVYKSRERIHGVVHIDHNTEQCVFEITSKELSNHKKKIAVFYVDHNADISREEQTL